MTASAPPARPTVVAIWLIVAGVIGWWAAFQLTLEKLNQIANPGAKASCDFSVLVQCGKNLDSLQGSLLGFPNPILGLTGWVAPIVVGVAILAGARFSAWFWILFAGGVFLAFCFVVWLITESIFTLGTLCPWCMVTWVVTIPTFYLVVLHILRSEILPVPPSAASFGRALMPWVPLMALLSYVVVGVIAELRLDVVAELSRKLTG